jgi:hypothetical protein
VRVLYVELDRKLAFKLAARAIEHTDEEIKEAGQDFFDMLRQADSQ